MFLRVWDTYTYLHYPSRELIISSHLSYFTNESKEQQKCISSRHSTQVTSPLNLGTGGCTNYKLQTRPFSQTLQVVLPISFHDEGPSKIKQMFLGNDLKFFVGVWMEDRSQGLRVDEDMAFLSLSHQPRSLLSSQCVFKEDKDSSTDVPPLIKPRGHHHHIPRSWKKRWW